jgi:hypothetical protein
MGLVFGGKVSTIEGVALLAAAQEIFSKENVLAEQLHL